MSTDETSAAAPPEPSREAAPASREAAPVPAATAPAAPADAPKAVGAGRGLLYITAAKVWFMVGGAAIGFILPHLLRSKVAYGEWGTILSWVSPLNNVVVTATIQTVSKSASRGPAYVEGTKRAALRLLALIGGGLALAYFLAAPLIAGFERDPSLTAGLRLTAGVVFCYSLYAVFVGAANGGREFHKQAGLDATFTTLRALFVCLGAVVFSSVMGSVAGFVAAAGLILLLSIALVGLGPERERVPAQDLLRFMLPVATYLLILNTLMFLDGWLLKRMVAQAAAASATLAAGRDPAAVASEYVGLYTAAQQVARIPYQAILAVTFIIFPLVSQATFANDTARTRSYVERAIRLPLLVVLALAVAVAARPDGLLNFFPRDYQSAGHALAILAFGYVAFSLLSIAGTIITGAGHTTATMIIGAITLVIDLGLTYGATRWALLQGKDPLRFTAAGTTASMALGASLSLSYLQYRFGAALRLGTAYKAAGSALIAIAVGRHLPLGGRIGGLVACALSGLSFITILFLSQEVTLTELRGLLQRKKG